MHLHPILFLDIETVPTVPRYPSLTEGMQREWDRKSKFMKSNSGDEATPAMLFEERAGIFAEFAKVVCISFGSISEQDGRWKMRLKALTNADEQVLLTEFCSVLNRFNERYRDLRFCGHNIREFDIPFLCRRMVINGIALPECMQVAGKKPWEVSHIDTLELWKFGDHKNFTSLSLLAEVLGIPSPKTDMDGSKVAEVFYKDGDLQRIGTYCIQDVLTSARVYLKLTGRLDVDPEPVIV